MMMHKYTDGELVIEVSVRTLCGYCKRLGHSDHNKWLQHKRDTRKDPLVKQKNKDRMKANGSKLLREQRLKGTRRLVTIAEWRKLRQGDCTYCGNPGGEVDHIIPLSKGGNHSIGNLTSSCMQCNRSKGSKLLIEWRRDANR